MTHGSDEVVGLACEDNALHNGVEIILFVAVVCRFVQQLFNDVSKFFGQAFSHLGASVF